MKKKYVFNSDGNMWLGTLTNAYNKAIEHGYSFFLFNDIVYFGTRENLSIEDTGIRKDDLK